MYRNVALGALLAVVALSPARAKERQAIDTSHRVGHQMTMSPEMMARMNKMMDMCEKMMGKGGMHKDMHRRMMLHHNKT
jgi:hypothetical protein